MNFLEISLDNGLHVTRRNAMQIESVRNLYANNTVVQITIGVENGWIVSHENSRPRIDTLVPVVQISTTLPNRDLGRLKPGDPSL